MFIRKFPSFLLLFALALSACSTTQSKKKSSNVITAKYQEALEFLEDKRYLEANKRFQSLKIRNPYSRYASLSSLRIGDTYFQQGLYLEAASAYKLFLDLYPKHKEASYALFRIGESNMKTVPDSIYLDLTGATIAIKSFRRFLQRFPKSQYRKKAKKFIASLRKKLGEKENYVGNFYFKRELWKSAIERYRRILKEYSDLKIFNEKALYRLAYSYRQIKERRKSRGIVARLKKRYPKGAFTKKVQSWKRQ